MRRTPRPGAASAISWNPLSLPEFASLYAQRRRFHLADSGAGLRDVLGHGDELGSRGGPPVRVHARHGLRLLARLGGSAIVRVRFGDHLVSRRERVDASD